MFSDKFKGGKAELNQTKSCIDLDELIQMLKSRSAERLDNEERLSKKERLS